MRPKARMDQLLLEALDEEVLVYDTQRHRAHSLNPTAAFVLSHCDGKRSVPELTRLLEEAFQEPASQEIVRLALERLGRARLLEEEEEEEGDQEEDARAAPLSGVSRGESRRKALRRMAKIGVALPVVMTIVTPTPAQAATYISFSDCFWRFRDNRNRCCTNRRRCVEWFGRFGACAGQPC